MGGLKELAVSFDSVRDKNVMQLRKINAALFPVSYQEKFYKDAVLAGEYAKLALCGDIHVGAIATRLEKKETGGQRAYIMTLGVLAPYRRRGIGSKLLRHVLSLCEQDPSVEEIYLHVQTSNDEALEFYKKFGFQVTGTIERYYRRIQPPDCYILSKALLPPSADAPPQSR
eukprot:jgi/Mesen1/3288/ME000191S02429